MGNPRENPSEPVTTEEIVAVVLVELLAPRGEVRRAAKAAEMSEGQIRHLRDQDVKGIKAATLQKLHRIPGFSERFYAHSRAQAPDLPYDDAAKRLERLYSASGAMSVLSMLEHLAKYLTEEQVVELLTSQARLAAMPSPRPPPASSRKKSPVLAKKSPNRA